MKQKGQNSVKICIKSNRAKSSVKILNQSFKNRQIVAGQTETENSIINLTNLELSEDHKPSATYLLQDNFSRIQKVFLISNSALQSLNF